MDIQCGLEAVAIAATIVGFSVAAWQILVKRGRLAVVSPLLVGTLLIAAMAQIARMLI